MRWLKHSATPAGNFSNRMKHPITSACCFEIFLAGRLALFAFLTALLPPLLAAFHAAIAQSDGDSMMVERMEHRLFTG